MLSTLYLMTLTLGRVSKHTNAQCCSDHGILAGIMRLDSRTSFDCTSLSPRAHSLLLHLHLCREHLLLLLVLLLDPRLSTQYTIS